MASIESQIRAKAQRNTELLAILAETDHAVPDLDSQTRYIQDMEAQLAKTNKKIKQLDFRRQKELKEHEAYRDSVIRRFAFKATGRKEQFESRAAKEEQEYLAVLQEELQAKELRKNLEGALAEARTVHTELDGRAARHREAQGELDALYEQIFAGPSPGFPEEDARERDKDDALRSYQEARAKAETEAQALRILEQAALQIRSALTAMQEALECSRADMWGVGGSIADMMERNALHKAEMEVSMARTSVMHAQRVDPAIKDLPPAKIHQGNLMSDVLFDNIFTDAAFHDKIKMSNADVQRCAQVLHQETVAAKARHDGLSSVMAEKEKLLGAARMALQKSRERAFERVLTGATVEKDDVLPPAYSE